MLFLDQLIFITKWFHLLSECEQILTLNTLLSQINYIQAQFITFVLEKFIHNLPDKFESEKANNLDYISSLILKPSNEVMIELMHLLPLFRGSNEESVTKYINLVISLLSQNKSLNPNLARRLISLLYIHPSFMTQKNNIIELLKLVNQYDNTLNDSDQTNSCNNYISHISNINSSIYFENSHLNASEDIIQFNLDDKNTMKDQSCCPNTKAVSNDKPLNLNNCSNNMNNSTVLENLEICKNNINRPQCNSDNYLNNSEYKSQLNSDSLNQMSGINGLINHVNNIPCMNFDHAYVLPINCDFIPSFRCDTFNWNHASWCNPNFCQLPYVQVTDTTNFSSNAHFIQNKNFEENNLKNIYLSTAEKVKPAKIIESRSVTTNSDNSTINNISTHAKLSRTNSLSTFSENSLQNNLNFTSINGVSYQNQNLLGFSRNCGNASSFRECERIASTTHTISAFTPTSEEQTMLLAPMQDHKSLSPQSSNASSGSFKSEDLSPDYKKEEIDPAMNDVGVWLKSLRLHKYKCLFQRLSYAQLLNLNDEILAHEGITKGARNKILIQVGRLKERQNMLQNLEKSLLEGSVSIRQCIGELSQMMFTPISRLNKQSNQPNWNTKSSFNPIIHPFTFDIPLTNQGKRDLPVYDQIKVTVSEFNERVNLKPPEEGDLPAQIFQMMSSIYFQLTVFSKPDTECLFTFIQLLETCMNHHSFSIEEKSKLSIWKAQVTRLWAMALQCYREQHKNSYYAKPRFGPRQSLPITPMYGMVYNLSGANESSHIDTQNVTYAAGDKDFASHYCDQFDDVHPMENHLGDNLLSPTKIPVTRTNSAPVQSHNFPSHSGENFDIMTDELHASLETLCIDMMKHAMGPAAD